jgi:hypothetical protein
MRLNFFFLILFYGGSIKFRFRKRKHHLYCINHIYSLPCLYQRETSLELQTYYIYPSRVFSCNIISYHYRNSALCRVSNDLSSVFFGTLCRVPSKKPLVKKTKAKSFFTECFILCTRQRASCLVFFQQ